MAGVRKLEGAARGPALEVLWPLGGRGEARVKRSVMKARGKQEAREKKRRGCQAELRSFIYKLSTQTEFARVMSEVAMAYTNRPMSLLTERNSNGKGARTRGRKAQSILVSQKGPKEQERRTYMAFPAGCTTAGI